MTFYPGNKKILRFGTQSGKGTAQTTPKKSMRVTDFTPNDVRQKIQLPETDSLAQESANAVVGVTPGFSFKCWLRPSEAAFFFKALLGSNGDSGSDPDYIHTIVPTADTPYLTVYECESGLLCNQYVDVRVTSITVSGGAGQGIEATIMCEALSFAAGASDPGSPAVIDEVPLTYPEVTVTKGGSHPGTVDQFEVTINRQGGRLQGDNGLTSLDYVNAKLAVTGSITKYVADDDDQRLVDTGSTSGTAPTTTIGTESLSILIARTSTLRVTIALTLVEWLGHQMAVRTDGTPLAAVMPFRTPPQATLAANVTVTSRDHLATPDT